MKISDAKKIIRKNIILILSFIIVGAVIGGSYAKLKKKTTFTAQTNIIVGHNLNHANHRNSTVLADLNMMDSYTKLVKDRQVLNVARKQLPKKMKKKFTVSDIGSSVSVDNHPHSVIIRISSSASSAKDATLIVNAVANAASKELVKIDPGIGHVRKLAPARTTDANLKTTPSIKKYLVLGAALGLLIGMIISFSLTTWQKFI